MFEFHGWATIHANDSDDPSVDESDARDRALTMVIREEIRKVDAPNRSFHLHGMNGTMHLIFCGDHNHRDDSVIDFFKRLSEIAPDSYGKLHVRDDEDSRGFILSRIRICEIRRTGN
jgi:Immunity protein 7